jgi:hypothetical protein
MNIDEANLNIDEASMNLNEASMNIDEANIHQFMLITKTHRYVSF